MPGVMRAIPAGIVLIYVAVVVALCDQGGAAFGSLLMTCAETMSSIWPMVGLCALMIAMVQRHRAGAPGSPWDIARDFVRSRWRQDRLTSVALPFLCFVPLLTAYNVFKVLYLPTAGFWAGRYIARSERALLGGHDAWQITHAILPSPWATQAIDVCYHPWFVPMVLGVVICSYAGPQSRIAWRYLTSYLLLLSVQGSLIAYLLPAAGPAFYGSMHPGVTRFAPLEATLHAQDLFLRAHGSIGLYSVAIQHRLLALFGQPEVALGAGISAMPSLHNAMATLFACAAWAIGRRTGIAATLYALLIWFGSIHLGWHYALDGIVAWALTILTWIGVGRLGNLLEQRHARSAAFPPSRAGAPVIAWVRTKPDALPAGSS